MKALTIIQPWATALLEAKDFENRTWAIPARFIGEPIALHAGAKVSASDNIEFIKTAIRGGYNGFEAMMLTAKGAVPRGAIIGVIWFDACMEASDSPWFAGPYGWRKARAVPVKPIPCRGALGLWDVPAEIADQLMEKVNNSRMV